MSPLSYKDAGVDLDLYAQAMERLPGLMRQTHTPRVMDLAGGFAGLFRLFGEGESARRYQDPVLVSGTDGVGTKIKVAHAAGVFETIGIDLVGMCVNDCLCLGAEPLFFLDYLALGKDNPVLVEKLVQGVTTGCRHANMALLGGETAIMPDVYDADAFDLAGFCVGVVERNELIDGSAIQPGDEIVGIASSGFHSNGYSLLRKVVFEHAGLTVDDQVAETGKTVGATLLEPTQIYASTIASIRDDLANSDLSPIAGLAHITGGGIAENVVRILPEGCRASIDRRSWSVPAEFQWIDTLGDISRDEMFRVFNMGIGMVVVARPASAQRILEQLQPTDISAWSIGSVDSGEAGVDYAG